MQGACPQIKDANKQTNRRDFEKARNGARPQIMEARKQDPDGACKGQVLKLKMQANKLT